MLPCRRSSVHHVHPTFKRHLAKQRTLAQNYRLTQVSSPLSQMRSG